MRSHLIGFLIAICIASVGAMARAAESSDLTGMWSGSYLDGEGETAKRVLFEMVLIQTGDEVSGFIRDRIRPGDVNDAWLFAKFDGTIRGSELAFQKVFDGTGKVEASVSYRGSLSEDRTTIRGGTWKTEAGLTGPFDLAKDAKTGPGPVSGIWEGAYSYPPGAGNGDVSFIAAFVHRGDELRGFLTEPDTFAGGNAPYLHATLEGRYSEDDRTLKLEKTYDRTAGVGHSVIYSGKLGRDGVFEGTWKLDALTGKFLMNRAAPSQ